MPKTKTLYVCQNCGATSATWIGKCPVCGMWNTYVEETKDKEVFKSRKTGQKNLPKKIDEINDADIIRFSTSIPEVDRVLGGGFVKGSIILLAGEPGIGKSTLALQLINNPNVKSLYVSGEESLQQIKLRAVRLNFDTDNTYFLNETVLENILQHCEIEKPDFVIIDSIQTLITEKLEGAPGSVGQIRETASLIQKFAKKHNITFLLIGHITKEGLIAGPKVLEHIVDVVLYFEGDRNFYFRELRSIKNRFGPSNELALFEMSAEGLKEVLNPSDFLISHSEANLSGISIAAALEGLKPFILEVQSLVSDAVYSSPQRVATGFDSKRLSMLLAVIEKRIGIRLGVKDIFLNIAGGLKITDTAIDLPVIMSILSSYFDVPISKKICFAGEISLSGEIKPVYKAESRIFEAEKLGFDVIFIPKSNKLSISNSKIQIKTLSNVLELMKIFFSNV